jgi:hypothetical protein
MKRLLILTALLFPSAAWGQQAPITVFVSSTPTIDTNIYATGELLGTKLTFTGAFHERSAAGYLTSVKVDDKAAQAHDLELVIFSEDPSGTTFTNQAAFDIADTDLTKVVAVISLGSATRFAWADNGIKFVGSLAIPLQGRSGDGATTTLYGALLSRGTPTFASTSDLKVTLGISQD